MSTKVCCTCLRTGRCEKCRCRKKGCTSCGNPACKFKQTKQQDTGTSILPATKEEAIDKGVDILKELIFRSDRAAFMNYKLSDDDDNWVFWLRIGMSLCIGLSTGGITHKLFDYISKDSNSWLYCLSELMSFIFACVVSFFEVCPKYLLPTLVESSKNHNIAAASFQEISIQINGFIASNIKNEVTPEKIESFITDMSSKRKEACKLARPSEKMYKDCEDNPGKFKERKTKLQSAVEEYWK